MDLRFEALYFFAALSCRSASGYIEHGDFSSSIVRLMAIKFSWQKIVIGCFLRLNSRSARDKWDLFFENEIFFVNYFHYRLRMMKKNLITGARNFQECIIAYFEKKN